MNHDTGIKPFVVDWRITSACDLECPFCYGPKKIKATSLSQAKAIADILIENQIQTVCFSGGEPLLYPFLQEVCEYFRENGVKIFLSTDGTFFEKHRFWIEKNVTKLSLPLDGYTPILHARAGRTEKNFYDVVSILNLYKLNKPFYLKVGTVISSVNLQMDNLLNLKAFLSTFSIDRWKIYQFLPEGDYGQHNYKSLICDNTVFDRVKDVLDIANTKFKIVTLARSQRTRSHFLIQPNGDVIIPIDQGTLIEEKILGNLFSEPFTSIAAKWSKEVNIENYLNNPRFMSQPN